MPNDAPPGAEAPTAPAIELAPASEAPSVSQKQRTGCFQRKKYSWPCFKAFFLKNFLVIGLITAIVFSLAVPWPGKEVDSWSVGDWGIVSTINVVTIFIVSGLTLKTDHIKDAVRQWAAALVGCISILLITPCAGFAVVNLPFEPPAYRYGLTIFALVPTTIASGVTLVTAARGNAALALMLTVITNVLGVFILPFTVPLVISQAEDVSLDPANLLIKLVMTILVPLIIGKILRESSAWVRKQVDKHKVALGIINNGSLICIVWQVLSSAQEDIINTAFGTLCLIALAAILLHVAYLIVNFILVKIFRFPHREAAAVLIMASEKTLPMAVTVIAATGDALGPTGQLTVPAVLAHISQVLIDAFLCDYLGKREFKKSSQALPITKNSGRVEPNGKEHNNIESNGRDPVTVEPVTRTTTEKVLVPAKSNTDSSIPTSSAATPLPAASTNV
jgi:sodium/bile acid cotransporter 7